MPGTGKEPRIPRISIGYSYLIVENENVNWAVIGRFFQSISWSERDLSRQNMIYIYVYITAIDYFTRSRIESSLRNKSTPCNTGYILTVTVVVIEWCYLLFSFTKSP